MKRIAFFVYGIVCHLLFLLVFAYMAGFVGNFVVPAGIDAPGAGFSWAAVLVDTGLILVFALQHSVMARPGFKRWWTRFVPSEIERSTYVLVSCLAMAAILAFWQPIGPVIWNVQGEIARASLWALFATGWLMVPLVSLLINHFDLFGTRQVWLQLRRRPYTYLPFGTPGIYRIVRHPLYVGWIIAFWATPTMSAGHLLFAALMSLYMLAAIPLEESDLVDHFGEQYADYREQVPALVPRIAALPKAGAEVTA